MAVADFQSTRQVRARIITCDPSTRRVEALLSDGAIIQVAVYEVPTLFRWPQVDEFWTLVQTNGLWTLGNPMEQTLDNPFPVESMEPGEARIWASVIRDETGRVINASSDFFNVRDYGAKGDGVTNDQPAIQAACNACAAAGGGTVYFPPGRYIWGGTGNGLTVRPKSGTRIIGCGDSTWCVRAANVNRPFFNLNDSAEAPPHKDLHIEDMCFDGNILQNDNTGGSLLNFINVDNLVVRNCIIQNAGGFQFAVEAFGCSNMRLQNNLLRNNRRDGFAISSTTDFIISGNIFRDFGYGLPGVTDQGDDIISAWLCKRGVIANNLFAPSPHSEQGRAIVTTSAKDIVISGNIIHGTWRSCILVGYQGGLSENIVIVGNDLGRAGENLSSETPTYGDLIHICSFDIVAPSSPAQPSRRILIDSNTMWSPRRHCINIECVTSTLGGTALLEGVEIKNNTAYIDQSQLWVSGTGRFVNCDVTGAVEDLRIIGNRSEFTTESIYLKGANIKRAVVKDHLAIDCGKLGATKDAYYFEGINGLEFCGSKAVDRRSPTKYTDYGARFVNVTGRVRIVDDDFTDTNQGNISWTGATPGTYVKRDNFGAASLP